MNTHLQLHDVSPERQRLIDLMRNLDFGRIEHLDVRDGEPVFDRPPCIVREVKFGAGRGPYSLDTATEFSLKAKVVELLNALDVIHDGVIEAIEVQNGLPFRMNYREVTA